MKSKMATIKRPSKKNFSALKGTKCFAVIQNKKGVESLIVGTVLSTGIRTETSRFYNRAKIKSLTKFK